MTNKSVAFLFLIQTSFFISILWNWHMLHLLNLILLSILNVPSANMWLIFFLHPAKEKMIHYLLITYIEIAFECTINKKLSLQLLDVHIYIFLKSRKPKWCESLVWTWGQLSLVCHYAKLIWESLQRSKEQKYLTWTADWQDM